MRQHFTRFQLLQEIAVAEINILPSVVNEETDLCIGLFVYGIVLLQLFEFNINLLTHPNLVPSRQFGWKNLDPFSPSLISFLVQHPIGCRQQLLQENKFSCRNWELSSVASNNRTLNDCWLKKVTLIHPNLVAVNLEESGPHFHASPISLTVCGVSGAAFIRLQQTHTAGNCGCRNLKALLVWQLNTSWLSAAYCWLPPPAKWQQG